MRSLLHKHSLAGLCLAGMGMLGPLNGCSRKHERPATSAHDASVQDAGARSADGSASAAAAQQGKAPSLPLVAAHREIMATWFELKVASANDERAVQRDLEAGLDEIARLETLLSEWRPDTEIARINAAAGKEAVEVGADTWTVLREGQAISDASHGAFDMTWAAMRGLYLFGPNDPKRLPTEAEIAPRRALVGYRDVLLDEAHHSVRLKRPGMVLGTGGIAKGYALDKVGALLEARGYNNYLLFAGGQVQVHGARDGRAWRIGIRHPRDEARHIGYFEVFDGSVSTSGDYEHSYVVDGQRVHHILDLATGRPATRSASVTLVARRGIAADALSTACFVMGPDACLAMIAKLPEPVEAVIITPDLTVHMTPGLAERVLFDPPLVHGKLPPTDIAPVTP